MNFEPVHLSAEQTGRIVKALRLPADQKALTVPDLVGMIETRLLAAAELDTTVSLSRGRASTLETAEERLEREARDYATRMNGR